MPPPTRYACLLFSPPPSHLLPLAEACYRFTPKIAVRGNEAIFLEIGGSLKLFHSEEALLRRVHALCARFLRHQHPPPDYRLGLGDSPTQALLPLLWPATHSQESFPLAALAIMLQPFASLESEHPLWRMLRQLQDLGLNTLADLKLLPIKTLAARFGEVGIRAHQALYQLPFVAWPQLVQPENISEHFELDTLTQSSALQFSQLLFYLKPIVDRLGARLFARSVKVQRFVLKIHEETFQDSPSAPRAYLFDLPLPQGSPSQLLRLIQERLQNEMQRNPLDHPLQAISLDVLHMTPLRRQQKDFLSDPEQEEESLSSLLARLQQRLGPQHVFVASPQAHYQPEKSWGALPPGHLRRSPNFDSNQHDSTQTDETEKIGERPTRLLPSPRLLKRHGDSLHSPLGTWHTLSWLGPERLSGEWWSVFFNRDYYKVLTQQGDHLWVFQDQQTQQFFLHGFFD